MRKPIVDDHVDSPGSEKASLDPKTQALAVCVFVGTVLSLSMSNSRTTCLIYLLRGISTYAQGQTDKEQQISDHKVPMVQSMKPSAAQQAANRAIRARQEQLLQQTAKQKEQEVRRLPPTQLHRHSEASPSTTLVLRNAMSCPCRDKQPGLLRSNRRQ